MKYLSAVNCWPSSREPRTEPVLSRSKLPLAWSWKSGLSDAEHDERINAAADDGEHHAWP